MNKIIETYKKKYGNMPIRNKLIVMTVSLILIPTVILTLIFYSVASRYIKRNTQASIMDTMWQAAENIDGKIRGIEDILFDISTDTEFQRYIKILDNPELSEYDFLVKSDKLKSIVTHKISKCNDIKAVYLTTNSGKEIQVKNVLEHYPNDIPMQDVINQKGGNVWETVLKEYDVIPVYKELVDLKTMSDMGCITLYFEKNYLFQVFQNIQVAESQDIYLLNANGESVDQIFPEELKKHVVFNEINKEMGEVSVQYKKNKRELVFCKLQTLPWTLVGIIDNEWQYRQFWNISVATLVLFLTISALLVLICIKVSKSISRPLDDLTEYMTAFSKGDFHIEAPVKYTDEIGILRKEFNAMVENTNHLIEKLFMEEKLKQEAQIKALQMQINPHFFYNTLDTINWLAQMHEAADISEVSQAFAKLMRFSLKSNTLISFEEELTSVENYMVIQFYRHGEGLKLDMDVEEELLYEFVPRHILLPMIENAVEHGISNKQGEKKIIIRGKIKNEEMIIDIFDNGQGMDEETLQGVFEYKEVESDEGHTSIGIRNVHQRLQLIYDKKAGVSISSRKGVGTVVTIRIPMTPVDE